MTPFPWLAWLPFLYSLGPLAQRLHCPQLGGPLNINHNSRKCPAERSSGDSLVDISSAQICLVPCHIHQLYDFSLLVYFDPQTNL